MYILHLICCYCAFGIKLFPHPGSFLYAESDPRSGSSNPLAAFFFWNSKFVLHPCCSTRMLRLARLGRFPTKYLQKSLHTTSYLRNAEPNPTVNLLNSTNALGRHRSSKFKRSKALTTLPGKLTTCTQFLANLEITIRIVLVYEFLETQFTWSPTKQIFAVCFGQCLERA